MTECTGCLKGKQRGTGPPTSFLSLPSELRNRIYELSLVQEEKIWTWRYTSGPVFHKRELTVGLLCASKTVHREASPIFYGQNRFEFRDASPEKIRSFLQQIGKNNASYIRNVTIDFPDFCCLNGKVVGLERCIEVILETLRGACENLITITTVLGSYDLVGNAEGDIAALDDPNVASEALALLDARFRSIASIQEIVVEVSASPNDHIRKTMESRGWVLRMTECEEMEETCGDSYGFESCHFCGFTAHWRLCHCDEQW